MMTQSRRIYAALIVVALAVAAYLVAVLASDHQQIRASLAGLSVWQLALILALSLLNYFLRFVRWHWYVSALGHTVPWWRHLGYYLAGFTLTITPGKAGEGIRAVYLKRHGVHYMDSMASLFMERLLDLLVISAFAVLVVSRLPDYQWLIAVSLVALSFIVWFLGLPSVTARLRRIEQGLHLKQAGYLLRHLSSMLEASARLRRPGLFAGGLLLGLVSWGAEGVALYYILVWLGADIPLPLAVGIYALSLLAGVVSLLPGGLGGTEMAMGFLLTVCGVMPSVAIAATLLCRLCTLWFAVVLGIAAVAVVGIGPLRNGPDAIS